MKNFLQSNSKNFLITPSSIEVFLTSFVSINNKVAYFPTEEYDVKTFKKNLLKIDSELEIIEFPNFDCNFFSNLSPTSKNKAARISALYNLINSDSKKIILLSSLKALTTKTLKVDLIRKNILSLDLEKLITYDDIIRFLNNSGYQRVDFVHDIAQYSIRGEVLDIFSPIYVNPVRVLFDFEKIESLNLFSTNNQLSFESIDKYNLTLASEFQFNKENIQCFRNLFRRLDIKNKKDYYASISEKIILPGSEQFFPIMNEEFESILNYMNDFKLVLSVGYEEKLIEFRDQMIDDYDYLRNFFLNDSNFFIDSCELLQYSKNKKSLFSTNSVSLLNKIDTNFSKNLNLGNNRAYNQKLVISLMKKKKTIVFCFHSVSSEEKLKNFLKSQQIVFTKLFQLNLEDLFNQECSTFLLHLEIKKSFKIVITKIKDIYFISDQEIYWKIFKKPTLKKIKEENIIDDYSNLKIGDYVVHNDHGIGKFNGLKIKNFNDVLQEFIEIIYHGDDKLFIPVENLDLISRYGHADIKVSPDKLGVQNWQHRKALVKKRIKDIAAVLIKTAAKRQLQKGDVIVPKKFEYDKFSSEFEFTETSDQLKSIHQIENDLSSGKPMDRLICGDVGFGKTEIAMRATFIVASAGYQVALICPKLLLINQHYKNFLKRFKNFNYEISKISRIESLKKKESIKQKIKNGEIEILIGTHAILSNDVSFKKLGLIIIDEEQSFGVEQKEKLKKLKPNCHVLTLSATPIPRTLQSSIFQLKNISLIKTPPLNRLNIKTFLMMYEKNQLRKIINCEIDRNGQIFYVAPRISDLEKIKKRLISLLPNLKFDIIHGQLTNNEIEKSYDSFFKKKSQLLLSTAMIESGLDISNVNTIIIEKPELFGLSQLYQLRGRVGRSSRQAFAYLMIENVNKLKEISLKKLQIISNINNLGAGFSIASNDLDMRGGGNIIGSEQSGHIKEVGLELYYKMLKETINELQNSKNVEEEWSPIIKLSFPISIPEDYVKDLDMRLSLYRRISNIVNIEELDAMLKNLKDMFGDIPSSFENLFKIIEIKIIAKKLSIKKIDNSNKGFVLEFKNDKMLNVEKLIKIVKRNSKLLKLMPESKLFFKNEKLQMNERIKDLKNLLSILLK